MLCLFLAPDSHLHPDTFWLKSFSKDFPSSSPNAGKQDLVRNDFMDFEFMTL